jgi:hypothetical protein
MTGVSTPFLSSHSLIGIPEGDYVDLSLNPERFTGYVGLSARRVWRAIYEENCFDESESSLSKMSQSGVVLPDTMAEVLYMDGEIPHDQCLEKRVYYKVISGELVATSSLVILISPFYHQDSMHQFRHISVTSTSTRQPENGYSFLPRTVVRCLMYYRALTYNAT